MALKVGELFASFTLDSKGLDGAISGAEKKLGDIGKGLGMTGAAMTAGVTRPIIGGFKEIYKAASGFETAMSRAFAIRGLTGDTQEQVQQMNDLNKEAMRVAAATRYSTQETAGAYEYMAMAGWSVNDMLSGLEPIVNLAIASGNDLAAVSDIVTDAMTAFGLEPDAFTDGINNVQYFTDVLSAAATNSNTNVEIMGETFKYVSAQAGAMKYSVNDVAIAIGLMANRGIKGSQAGTALKNLLTNMAKPTAQMRDAMDKLGVSLDDGNGNMLSFREVMVNLRKGFGGLKISEQELIEQSGKLEDQFKAGQMTEEDYNSALEDLMGRAYGAEGSLKAATAAALAGKYGMAGLLAIVGASDEEFNELAAAIDNSTGSTATMVRVMMDNAEGAVARLDSAVNVLETNMGLLYSDTFKNVVNGLTDMVNQFNDADDVFKLGAMRSAALAAAIGPVLGATGGLMVALPAIAKGVMHLTSPVGLLSLGLLALGAAAVDTDNTIGTTFVAAMKKAGDAAEAFARKTTTRNFIRRIEMADFLNSIRDGADEIPRIMGNVGKAVGGVMRDLGVMAPVIGRTALSIVQNIGQGIEEGSGEVIRQGAYMLTRFVGQALIALPGMVATGAKIAESVLEGFGSVDWAHMGEILNKAFTDSFTEAEEALKSFLFGEGEEPDESSWRDIGKKLVEKVKLGIEDTAGNAKDFVGGLILGKDYNPDDSLADFGVKMIDKVLQGADEGISGATELATGIIQGLSEIFTADNMEKAAGDLSTIAEAMISGIAAEIPKLGEYAQTIMQNIGTLLFGKDETGGLLPGAIKGAATLATGLLEALTQGISDVISGGTLAENANVAASLIQGIADLLPTAFSAGGEIISAGAKLGTELLTSLTQGITDVISSGAIGKTANVAASLVQGIIDLLPVAFEAGGQILSAGAKLGSEIMTSITRALGDSESRAQIAKNISDAASSLIEGLFSGIGDLASNADVLQFVTDLGNAIAGAGSLLGDVAGRLLQNLFSAEGLAKAADIGKSIGTLLLNGVKATFGGVAEFMSAMVQRLLGYDPKTAQEFEQAYAESMAGDFSEIMTRAFGGAVEESNLSARVAPKAAESFGELLKNSFFDFIGDESYWNETGGENLAGDLYNSFFTMLSRTDSIGGDVKDYFLKNFSDINIWQSLADAILENGGSIVGLDIRSILAKAIFGDISDLDSAAEGQAAFDSLFGGAQQTAEQKGQEAGQAYNNGVAAAVDKSGNANLATGMATVITENGDVVSGAVASVSNEAVQAAMMTLSAENGTQIGSSFASALVEAISGASSGASTAGSALGGSATGALMGAAGYNVAFSIGVNFGQGFANGISSAVDAVTTAASLLGTAAIEALSASIAEGSPSKITYQSGANFDAGFINAIVDDSDKAIDAAEELGRESGLALERMIESMPAANVDSLPGFDKGTIDRFAAETETLAAAMNNISAQSKKDIQQIVSRLGGKGLSDTVRGIGGTVERETQLPTKAAPVQNETERSSTYLEPMVRAMTGIVTQALGSVGVYMDGEPVGHLTSGVVSGDIAKSTKKRRYATA